jgi:hypothetical protein
MWPRPREPISTTATSLPSGPFSRVSGTPISLLKLFSATVAVHLERTAAAAMSLTEVLPTDPVTPITPPGTRSRARRASAARAATVSATSMATARSTGPGTLMGPRLVR